MSWLLIGLIVSGYFLHAFVIQPWLTTLAHNAYTYITGKVTSLNASGTTITKAL